MPKGSITASDHDEGTTRLFLGTSWREHNAATLAGETHTLNYFTPEALAYFLPSFMLAAIRAPTSGVFDALFNRIRPPKDDSSRPSFQAWWQLLSFDQ
ncbi:MAG TPA: hypothetical protein VN581_01565, partial [Patescibacteria group bacterium]|nr:hypothetical protein [Patescibacteria group bacterium]